MALTPRTQALAYRIWCYCDPIGWNVNCQDIADALDEDVRRIVSVVNLKRWGGRLRAGIGAVSRARLDAPTHVDDFSQPGPWT